ncbi:MAG: tetratricopeptide repeat protein [Tepidiformaceae bacterium]
MRGEFDEAETLIQQALAMGQRAGTRNAATVFGLQLGTLRRDQGRSPEVEPAIKAFVAQFPAYPLPRCALALLYSEYGRMEEARHEFEQIAAAGFSDLPREAAGSMSMTLAVLGETCANLGDAASAASLYDLLLPFAQRMITNSGWVCLGSASFALGRLAATMARWDEAAHHFEDALEMNARMGARPWLARTQHHYAEMLLARGQPGDRERALDLMSKSLETASQLGMAKLVEWCEALRVSASGGAL